MTSGALLGPAAVLVAIVCFGASTAFLRAAILDGTTDTARFLRVGVQTAIVFAGVSVVGAAAVLADATRYGAVYPALNGLLSGAAFVSFSRGLESAEASTAKPLLAVGTIVSVVLGILLLGEQLTPRKAAGIAFGIAAVYLLTSER